MLVCFKHVTQVPADYDLDGDVGLGPIIHNFVVSVDLDFVYSDEIVYIII